MHLTLCFLGARPVGEIPALCSALSLCAEEVGELCVGAPLWLPPRRPRALAVEVRDRSGALSALQASLIGILAEASGWKPERRRFRPHITLARLPDGAAPVGGELGGRPLLAPTPQLSFMPGAMVLYRSLPAAAGTTYDPLATCELGAAGL